MYGIPRGAFSNCYMLTSIVLPKTATYIHRHAFYGCVSLVSIVIPDSITDIDNYVFYGCASLTSIVLPDGVEGFGWYAFSGCTSLTSIRIPDSVIVMNEPSLPKFEPLLKKGGLLILNSSLINSRPTRQDIEVVCVPCNEIAKGLGMDRIDNLVALGAFIKKTGAVSLQSVASAMKKVYKRAKPEMLALNQRALQAGFDFVK